MFIELSKKAWMSSGLTVFVDAVREVLDGCFVLYKGISCG